MCDHRSVRDGLARGSSKQYTPYGRGLGHALARALNLRIAADAYDYRMASLAVRMVHFPTGSWCDIWAVVRVSVVAVLRCGKRHVEYTGLPAYLQLFLR